jgi:hypothetical protein
MNFRAIALRPSSRVLGPLSPLTRFCYPVPSRFAPPHSETSRTFQAHSSTRQRLECGDGVLILTGKMGI